MTWDITGRHVLVTGATSGIGKATAEALARRGARVTISARDRGRGDAAVAEIQQATGVEVTLGLVDLADLDSVRGFADWFIGSHERLDVLVNNAGVMSGSRRCTVDGYEWTFAVNHLGPFLLTNLLVDLLTAAAPSRIINVSSEVHRRVKTELVADEAAAGSQSYSASKAYATSKLANMLFTVELNRRLGGDGITAVALHPGVVATSFGSGAEGSRWMATMMTLLKPVLSTPAKGAATSVFLATAADEAVEAGVYWSNSEPKEPLGAAIDPTAAERLWSASERLVGLVD